MQSPGLNLQTNIVQACQLIGTQFLADNLSGNNRRTVDIIFIIHAILTGSTKIKSAIVFTARIQLINFIGKKFTIVCCSISIRIKAHIQRQCI